MIAIATGARRPAAGRAGSPAASQATPQAASPATRSAVPAIASAVHGVPSARIMRHERLERRLEEVGPVRLGDRPLLGVGRRELLGACRAPRTS